MPAGSCMEEPLRRVCKGIRMGKILIKSSPERGPSVRTLMFCVTNNFIAHLRKTTKGNGREACTAGGPNATEWRYTHYGY